MKRALGPLDAGDVRLFQVIVYVAYIIAGVQSLALGAPPNAVTQAMGHLVAGVWIALVVACPGLTLLGMWQERRPYGLYAQVAGNSGVAFATAAYVVAVLQATWAERASFAAWMATSLTICAALITWRDARRIRQVRLRVREIEEGRP